jgi:hypothetical protein
MDLCRNTNKLVELVTQVKLCKNGCPVTGESPKKNIGFPVKQNTWLHKDKGTGADARDAG